MILMLPVYLYMNIGFFWEKKTNNWNLIRACYEPSYKKLALVVFPLLYFKVFFDSVFCSKSILCLFYLLLSFQRKGKEPTEHVPEVILNNFTTRLGHSVGRMFAALFPHDPQFIGRQVATFHNQRDYIFFRFHRWRFPQNSQMRENVLVTYFLTFIFLPQDIYSRVKRKWEFKNLGHVLH